MADEALVHHLQASHSVTVIETNKGELRQGAASIAQLPTTIRQVARILRAAVRVRHGRFDVIYHSPSQTRIGNLKDLLLLGVIGDRRDRVVLHLHGGGFRSALNSNTPLRSLNRRWFGSVGQVIVLGDSLRGQLDGIAPPDRITAISNFADDEIYVDEKTLAETWSHQPLSLLFIGSLFESKGWPAVVGAARAFSERDDDRVTFTIAGCAPQASDLAGVLAAEKELENLTFLGEVDGSQRANVLAEANIVAVPTEYPWEGQPLVILEAYASGSVVLATNHAGIPDVFRDEINGWSLDDSSAESLVAAVDAVLSDPQGSVEIARNNRAVAEGYRQAAFVESCEAVLVEVDAAARR